MPSAVDRPGVFRGQITDYGLSKYESGAIAVRVLARLDQYWGAAVDGAEPEWIDWPAGEMEADGNVFIIKKDKSINQNQVQSLMKATGWDGSIVSINSKAWQPEPCQFVINEEEYQGNVQRRISFVNEYDRVPGGMSVLDDSEAKALEAQFGGQIRALKGNAARNTEKAKGKPPTPPKKPAAAATGSDDTPF